LDSSGELPKGISVVAKDIMVLETVSLIVGANGYDAHVAGCSI